MVKVNAPVYVNETLYTPEGPDVTDEHLPLIGDHLFDGGKPAVDEHAGESLTDKVERLKAELDEALAALAEETAEVEKAKAEADAKAAAEAEAAKAAETPAAQAGLDKWLAYAESKGIQVPDDAREDKAKIRSLVEEHEKSQG